ncbi:hypothetical protein SAMN05216499_110191 [Actinacidiphila paucisporea]|uniref:Uncharacterized protein n=1 Tax=Actinacidiphila paucisporea TaxID=310782 RepID=A0A1M7I9K8_9ACTN|nr:hypothetical protein SAMN05216499_110191 [Actinacidiphila paucisporea]
MGLCTHLAGDLVSLAVATPGFAGSAGGRAGALAALG